jgi:signal transduction histidine kinase
LNTLLLRIAFRCSILFFVFLSPLSLAHDLTVQQAAVRVVDIALLRDSSSLLGIEEVAAPAAAAGWRDARRIGERVLGYTGDALWLRVLLANDLPVPVVSLLQAGAPRLRDVRLYSRSKNGGWQERRAGLDVPVSAREVHSRYPVFGVRLAAGEQREFFLRISSGNAIHVMAATWTPAAFTEREQRADFVNALQSGAAFLLAVYGVILFAGTRDRNYLYFAFLLSSYAMYELSIYQYAHQYLWPSAPEWSMRAPGFFMGLACLANALLLARMLDTRRTMPLLDRLLRLLGVAAFLLAILTVTAQYANAVRPLHVVCLLTLTLSLVAVVLAMIRRLPRAHLLLAVFFLFWMVALLRIGIYLGFFPADWLLDYTHGWNVVLAGLLMTLLLIDQVFSLNKERMQVQQEILRGQVRAREQLESEVQARTAELLAAKEHAESADAAKSRFLAQLSHELRTPLHSVLGNAGLMLGESRGIDDNRRLQSIQRSGRHLLALIEEVIEYVRGDAGRITLQLADASLRELLRGVLDEMTPEAQHAGIGLLLQVDDDLPDNVHTDSVRLRQVLINLVGNALRHSRGRIVSLQAHSVGESDSKVLVRFEVHDDGDGVGEDEQGVLFEPFWQSPAGGRTPGLGLGLPISRQLVGLLGGELAYERRPRVGSVFLFTLPLATPLPAAAHAGMPGRSASGTWRVVAPAAANPAETLTRPSPAAITRLRIAVGLGLVTDLEAWVSETESAEPQASEFIALVRAALARLDLSEIRRLAGN